MVLASASRWCGAHKSLCGAAAALALVFFQFRDTHVEVTEQDFEGNIGCGVGGAHIENW